MSVDAMALVMMVVKSSNVAVQLRQPHHVKGHNKRPLGDMNHVPPAEPMALLTCRLVDADSEPAVAQGRQCVHQFDIGLGKQPTCIDGLLLDTRVTATLQKAWPLDGSGIPGHTPVAFALGV